MYLEERVEQLEALAVDQSKQSELIAKAVAKLTIDTQQGLDSLRKGQADLQKEVVRLADSIDGTNERVNQLDRKMEQRFDEVNAKFDQVNDQFAQVNAKFDQVNDQFVQVNAKFDQVNDQFAQVNAKFDQVNDKFAQVDAKQNQMQQNMNEMRQDIAGLKVGQELILQILREKLP